MNGNNQLKHQFKQSADHSIYCCMIDSDPEIRKQTEVAFGFIKEGIEEKVLKDVDCEFLGYMMFGSILSMINYLTKHPEKRNDKAFIEQAWEMSYNAIKA